MAQLYDYEGRSSSFLDVFLSTIGRILVSIAIPIVTFIGLWQGFVFLRDSEAPKAVVVLVAIVWGVGGVAALYLVSNWLVEQLPAFWTRALQPFIFVGPGIAILFWYLAFPTIRTFYISLFSRDSSEFVGLSNYLAVFTERIMFEAFRNNLLWIVFGATLSVVFGLLIAVLADRSRYENFAKALIFLPMAISMVGAGVIWNFIYEVKDVAGPQIGLLNAIWVGLGGQPVAWTASNQPWNNLFLIVTFTKSRCPALIPLVIL